MHLTSHQRHARLVKLVRKDYQKNHPGSRLFPNNSGVAWQGNAISGAGKVELFNPRPVFYGIPEPEHKNGAEKSGGADLLGWTIKNNIPIFTSVECKTGNARLQKNQKIFRNMIKKINGIYYTARECPECWDKWEPVYYKSKIIDWIIPPCINCDGVGYKLEE